MLQTTSKQHHHFHQKALANALNKSNQTASLRKHQQKHDIHIKQPRPKSTKQYQNHI